MKKIMEEQRIIARDQNKVFVERAADRRLSAGDAEVKYGLDDGKANAFIEFDIEPALLLWRKNPQLRIDEFFIVGDVDLTGRNPKGFHNH
jgi:hypothetical protein